MKVETLGTLLVGLGLLLALPAGAWHGFSSANDVPADWIVDSVTYSAVACVGAGILLSLWGRSRSGHPGA